MLELYPDRAVGIRGVDNHEIKSMPLITAGGVASTISGDVIVIMHQYECHGKNKTVHSSPQMGHHKNKVDDRSIKVGGIQHMNTLENYKIALSIMNVLP